jgi:hypothetical protein
MNSPSVIEQRRLRAPTVTPQALAWDGHALWMSSRDLGTLYKVDRQEWRTVDEIDPPGIVWAAVATNGAMHFTIGKGLNDDRYVYRYSADAGFIRLFACPDFTGSYLSYDGEHLYLSQWYKHRLLKFDVAGHIIGEIDVGAEVCGHTFVDGLIYVLRGQEQPSEDWRIARLDPREQRPIIEDLAVVPFAARSLTFDGEFFWSNYRAQDLTMGFTLPV